jgi:PTH1 family peptidyl-tRNA hydrolase
MDYLITFLGNPGSEYAKTRHNIAWMLLESTPYFSQLSFSKKFHAIFTQHTIGATTVGYLLPQTYMNLSGQSVRACCDFYKIPSQQVLVVHDELDLEFGKISFKKGGGDAGHNGLKSITSHLGTSDYHRLRLGIGRPPFGAASDWVLSNFSKDETSQIELYFKGALEALNTFLNKGPQVASNLFNKKMIIN